MPPHRGPFENSYHVDGGRLIAGEYPGAHPYESEAARTKLRALLDAGVRTFIDLTEPHELEPYAELLSEEATALDVKPRHVRLPILDVSTPRTPAVMHEILDTIDAALATGNGVYVHCWGGVGRTGTVIGCYLVRSGMTGADALARVNELFGSMEKSQRRPRSPETDEQEAYVLAWEETDIAR
jgi:protein-tyrosine phosphatase